LLVEIGRKERLQRIVGRIAAENTTMKRVSEEVGFKLNADSTGDWVAEIQL
jgi:RimJ/RimL family protein N-acetyltransferase